MAEYEAMGEDLRGYKEGEEIELEIKDRETFELLSVKAKIFFSKTPTDQREKLWIRAMETGRLKDEPWWIEIIEEISHDEFARRKFKRDTIRYGAARDVKSDK